MFKSILFATLAVVGLQSNASDLRLESVVKSIAIHSVRTHGLNWNVGDSADYNMAGGIIQGTMHMFVREAADPGYWMEQDADMGFLGKQKIEILINKETGEIVQMLVNGQKQDPPAADDEEVVDSHKDHITVPKGDFDCFYLKIHSKSQNNDSEAWVNPTIVPITGMIKTIAPSQLGDITIEMTDYKKMQ